MKRKIWDKDRILKIKKRKKMKWTSREKWEKQRSNTSKKRAREPKETQANTNKERRKRRTSSGNWSPIPTQNELTLQSGFSKSNWEQNTFRLDYFLCRNLQQCWRVEWHLVSPKEISILPKRKPKLQTREQNSFASDKECSNLVTLRRLIFTDKWI